MSRPSSVASASPLLPCSQAELQTRLEACPKLASLRSVNRDLVEALRNEQGLASQIAAVIRRDPSLTTRLLKMVNSVYYGLSAQVNDIEEAVFFLGLRQIRELSLATPIIEDLTALWPQRPGDMPWKELWAHSIGTAILTQKILTGSRHGVSEETAYLAGLLHNVGKLLLAMLFPAEAAGLAAAGYATPADVGCAERALFGWDHAQAGAHYLAQHGIAEEVIVGVRFHNEPDQAPHHRIFPAAVQVADYLVRHAGISGGFEKIGPVEEGCWTGLAGWRILYGAEDFTASLARASLTNTLRELPGLLRGLVT